MAKLYAWTTFPVAFNERGQEAKRINVGDEIDRKDVPCTDAEWQEYIDRGLISEQKYPNTPNGVSPNEYFASKTSAELAAEAQAEVEAAHAQLEAIAEQQKEVAKAEAAAAKAGSAGATGAK